MSSHVRHISASCTREAQVFVFIIFICRSGAGQGAGYGSDWGFETDLPKAGRQGSEPHRGN